MGLDIKNVPLVTGMGKLKTRHNRGPLKRSLFLTFEG